MPSVSCGLEEVLCKSRQILQDWQRRPRPDTPAVTAAGALRSESRRRGAVIPNKAPCSCLLVRIKPECRSRITQQYHVAHALHNRCTSYMCLADPNAIQTGPGSMQERAVALHSLGTSVCVIQLASRDHSLLHDTTRHGRYSQQQEPNSWQGRLKHCACL